MLVILGFEGRDGRGAHGDGVARQDCVRALQGDYPRGGADHIRPHPVAEAARP